MKTLATSLLVVLTAPVLFAAPVFFYDFQNDVINAAPAGVALESVTGGRIIKVVGGAFDPFVGDGANKSLLFQKTSGNPASNGIARATWTLAAQDSGVLRFDNYTQVGTGAQNSQFAIHFLQGGTLGINVWWNNAGLLTIQDGATSLQVANAVPINTKTSISVSYSIEEQSFGVSVNGSLVEAAGGKSSFAFQNVIGELGFDAFRLSISNSSSTINAINYVDNVSFSTIPEPSSAGILMGGGALGLMLATRRRAAK